MIFGKVLVIRIYTELNQPSFVYNVLESSYQCHHNCKDDAKKECYEANDSRTIYITNCNGKSDKIYIIYRIRANMYYIYM